MSEESRHLRMMFGLKDSQKPNGYESKTMSGKEQFRPLYEQNRVFGAAIIACLKLESKPPPQPPPPDDGADVRPEGGATDDPA